MKIQDIELTENHKNMQVVYKDKYRMLYGVLTDWTKNIVFVKFAEGENSHACKPDCIKWSVN